MAPLLAKVVASGDQEEAQKCVSESIYLCNILGLLLGTELLVCYPCIVLSTLVLEANAPAMESAMPYLRWRALIGMVHSLIGATGLAAH
jgi:Na+-driven multidrug efflux pump